MIEMGMVNSAVTKDLLESAQKENITEEETTSKHYHNLHSHLGLLS